MTLVGEDKKILKTHKVVKMEVEACMHGKFGFCKFKDTCKGQHFSQTCELLSACKTIQTCQKRHPKSCKWLSNGGGCRFGKDCDYKIPLLTQNMKVSERKWNTLKK